MYSGYLILYLLFVKKQFGSASDGISVVAARAAIHAVAVFFLHKFARGAAESFEMLPLAYIFVICTIRYSTFMLTRGLQIRRSRDARSSFNYKISRIFSTVECLPAVLVFFITVFYSNTAGSLLSFLVSTTVFSTWIIILDSRLASLGHRRKVFKQYISLTLQLVLPIELFRSNFDHLYPMLSIIPVGYSVGVVLLFILLLFLTGKADNRSPETLSPDEDSRIETERPKTITLESVLVPKIGAPTSKIEFETTVAQYLDAKVDGFAVLKARYCRYLTNRVFKA